MKSLQKKAQKRNDKGFSLVELIIVIAIMAVLIAVLAPQFIKYVDRSRQSNDATMVAGIVTAVQTGVSDISDYNIEAKEYKVTLTKGTSGGLSIDPTPTSIDGKKTIEDAIKDACGDLDDLKPTANKWKADIEITFDVGTDGNIKVTYMPVEFADYIDKEATTPAPAP